MLAPDNSAAVTTLRVRIFVDFWNFDISNAPTRIL